MAQDISSERRSEDVSSDRGSEETESKRAGRETEQRMERREVKVEDPDLSPEINQRLTEELQEAVGATSVEVPADRPRATAGEPTSAKSVITLHRVVLAISLAFVLALAAVIALTTGSWWLLPVAALVHALGTMVVVTVAVRITRDVEHPSPTLAAAMSEEGISSPDHRFSQMVEEFRGPEAEDLGEWDNDRTVRPQDDPATASVQQSHSITATSQPSTAAPGPRATDVFIGSLAFAFAVVSVVVPVIGGGNWLWLTPAVVVPICAGLLAMDLFARSRDDGAPAWWTSSRGIITLWATTVVAVAVFCLLVALFVTS